MSPASSLEVPIVKQLDLVPREVKCPHCGRDLPGGSGPDAIASRRAHSLAEDAIFRNAVLPAGDGGTGHSLTWVEAQEKDGLVEPDPS